MKPGRLAASALLLAVLFGTRAASTETYKAAETFDAVWKIVKDSHFDPAFDVAFMLNHLLLKRLHVPEAGDGIERSARDFWGAYRSTSAAELLPDLSYVLGHVGCLMVARVDGKSPAEYLRETEREWARDAGTALLLAPPDTLDEALGVVRRRAA